MRRTTVLKLAAAGSALAALSIGGAAAVADTDDPESSGVVNKNGHEVDEHSADGQARAAEARAQRLEKAAEREPEDTETDEPEEQTDKGNHGGPAAQAGDHPNVKAFENPMPHEPQNDGAQGPKDGLGPDDHAGDHPDENATDGPGNNGRGGE